MNIIAKIKEIKDHPQFTNSRCINTLLDAMDAGISPEEHEKLFNLVEKAYKKGRYKKPSYVRHQFDWTIVFIEQEFSINDLKE